jgi:transposase-like protein
MKARIALEAIKGQKTIQEIASHYGVHPNQVTNWKRQAIDGVPAVFADRRSQPDTSESALRAELYRLIAVGLVGTVEKAAQRFAFSIVAAVSTSLPFHEPPFYFS